MFLNFEYLSGSRVLVTRACLFLSLSLSATNLYAIDDWHDFVGKYWFTSKTEGKAEATQLFSQIQLPEINKTYDLGVTDKELVRIIRHSWLVEPEAPVVCADENKGQPACIARKVLNDLWCLYPAKDESGYQEVLVWSEVSCDKDDLEQLWVISNEFGVTVRWESKEASERLGNLKPDTIVRELDRQGEWLKVETVHVKSLLKDTYVEGYVHYVDLRPFLDEEAADE